MYFEKKIQQLQKGVRFLNQQKKRDETKIEKMFRNNKVSLSVDIDENINCILISKTSTVGATEKTVPAEE